MIYGHRARIGFTSPPVATEVFPYEFYLIAPKGVTLIVSTLTVAEMNTGEIADSFEISMRVAREQARAGAGVIVFGGVPINTLQGFENVDRFMAETSAALGVQVTTSLNSQTSALKAVGARKVAVVHPFDADDLGPRRTFKARLEGAGFEYLGCEGAGYPLVDLGRIPEETVLELSRKVMQRLPQADTILVSVPHWAVNTMIDRMETELGVNVVTSSQAIVWNGMRLCGVNDTVAGFGRLLREA